MPGLFERLDEILDKLRGIRKASMLNSIYGGSSFANDGDRMDAFKYAMGGPMSPAADFFTGRLHPFEPPVFRYTEFERGPAGSPIGCVEYNPHVITKEFNYAALEQRVVEQLHRLQDEGKVREWLLSDDTKLPVKVEVNDTGGVWIKYGLARIYVGGDGAFDTLTHMGFRVEVSHKRYYSVPERSEPVLMSAGEARYRVPISGSLVYRKPGSHGDVEVVSGEIDSLQANGGVTTARVYHPAGFWGEGVARCRPDEWRTGDGETLPRWVKGDNFDKEYGRILAIQRACDAMAEVTPDA